MGCLPKIIAALLALPLLALGSVVVFYTLPRLGALPEGERLARVQASPHYRGGYFHNVATPCGLPVPQGAMPWAQGEQKPFISILWETFFGSEDSTQPGEATPFPVEKPDLAALPRERDALVWFGHSSYLLQLGGKRILTDPVFGTASPIPGINRAFEKADVWSAADMPEVDVLLITHDHYDHLDYATVREIQPRVGRVICPLGIGAHLELWGYPPEKILELDWGEHASLPGLRVNAHTAYHYSGRNFNTRRRALWASYVLEVGGRRIFVGGDSGYATHFAAIGRRYGHIDYAVMENGQYNPRWRQNHMLPHELPHAIRDLRARRVLTVHHSKYRLSQHPWYEPLENALRLRESGLAVDLPRIGEIIWLDEPPRQSARYWWRSE